MPLRRITPEENHQRWWPRKSVRLYLDDLDDITAVMRQVDNEVRVKTDEFAGTITTAEELRDAKPRSLDPLLLVAGSEERNILVQLSRPVVVQITPGEDLHLIGAAQAILALLTRRHTLTGGWSLPRPISPRHFLPVMAATVFYTAAYLGGYAASGADFTGPTAPVLLEWVVILTLSFATFMAYRLVFGKNMTPSATIVLAYRADAPTWLERHRTPILIALITNVVVAALFLLLGLWLA